MDFRRHYHTSLLDLWRDELTVMEALAMVDRLPGWSCFVSEVARDDEAIAQLDTDDLRAGPPALTDWTPEVDRLARIEDRLGDLVRAVVGGYSKRVPKIRPVPRPVTALDRAKTHRRRAAHEDLMQRVKTARERARVVSAAGA